MTTTNEISILRLFDAPIQRVFRQWVSTEHLAAWFAPDPFAVTECSVDLRVGGRWRVAFGSGSSTVVEQGEYLEIVEPHRLVFTLTQALDGKAGPQTTVTVVLTEKAGQTEMSFLQTGFESNAHRDDNAQGWGECFDKLARDLARAS